MSEAVAVENWDEFVDAFERFFEGVGTVEVEESAVSFSAVHPVTGLSVDRAGNLSGSMPLHAVEGAVEVAVFDRAQDEIRLRGPDFAYAYRLPPGLRPPPR